MKHGSIVSGFMRCDARVKAPAYGTRVINNIYAFARLAGARKIGHRAKKCIRSRAHQAAIALNRRKHYPQRDINYSAIANH